MITKSASILITLAVVLFGAAEVTAQEKSACRLLCTPEFGVEPTITLTSIFGGARIMQQDGTMAREPNETEFEVVLSLGLPTRISWLAFTIEGSFEPFDQESTPELEFETNARWLASNCTGGWIESTIDLVDDFSPAARPRTAAPIRIS